MINLLISTHFKYNSNGDVVEEREYSVHTDCDSSDHTDCNESIPDCKEYRLHKFNNYEISENVCYDKTEYKYKYDDMGNWIAKEVYGFLQMKKNFVKRFLERLTTINCCKQQLTYKTPDVFKLHHLCIDKMDDFVFCFRESRVIFNNTPSITSSNF